MSAFALLLALGLALPRAAAATPTISTFAGDPLASGLGIGLGQRPVALAPASGGVVYVTDTDSNSVRLVNSKGNEYTIAGLGGGAYSGDGGPAAQAELNSPQGVAVDSAGNLLIADSDNHRVRMVASSFCSSGCPYGLSATRSGYIYTVAGTGVGGDSGDGGPARSARLMNPVGVAIDSAGDLLIAGAGNGIVRLVAAADCSSSCPYGLSSTTAGDIYRVAGNEDVTYTGDGSVATATGMGVQGIGLDGHENLLIADELNHAVRVVADANCSSSCPYGLSSMAVGHIYTVAGTGTGGYTGDGGPASAARLRSPTAPVVDSAGNVLIADTYEHVVRVVAGSSCSGSCPYGLSTMTAGDIYTVTGTGTQGYTGSGVLARTAPLSEPFGVAVDSAGNLLIAGYGNRLVRLVAAGSCSGFCGYGLTATTPGDIYDIAGNRSWLFSGDYHAATAAEIGNTEQIAVNPSGEVLLAEAPDFVVRAVVPRLCTGSCPFGLAGFDAGQIVTIAGTGFSGDAGHGISGTAAMLGNPTGVAFDFRGDALIADRGASRIKLVAASPCSSHCPFGLGRLVRGHIYRLAGTGAAGYSGDGGPAAAAKLSSPYALTLDRTGDLLISDTANERVRLLAASACSVSCPYGLSRMRRGHIYLVAGNGSYGHSGDGGPASVAGLASPMGLAVDQRGDLLIAGQDEHRIRLVANSSCTVGCPYGFSRLRRGHIYTVAGNAGAGSSGDGGPARLAKLKRPTGVAVDGRGDLLIADSANNRVRLVSVSACSSGCPYGRARLDAGEIVTLAGSSAHFAGDGGPADLAKLHFPTGLAFERSGTLLVADSGNRRIRKLTGGPRLPSMSGSTSILTDGRRYTNQLITLRYPGVILPGRRLTVAFSSRRLHRSKSKRLTFRRAVLYIDRGVKRTRTKVVHRHGQRKRVKVTVHRPNATTRRSSHRFRLRLRHKRRGTHTLTLVTTYRKRTGRRGHRHAKTVQRRVRYSFQIS